MYNRKEARLYTQRNTEDDLILKQHRCANLKSHINYKYLKTGNNLLEVTRKM
jgi:hypothetical protein